MGGFSHPAFGRKRIGIAVHLQHRGVHEEHVVFRHPLADMAVEADALAVSLRKCAELLLLPDLLRGDRHRKIRLLSRAEEIPALPLDKRVTVLQPDPQPGKLNHNHLSTPVRLCSAPLPVLAAPRHAGRQSGSSVRAARRKGSCWWGAMGASPTTGHRFAFIIPFSCEIVNGI